MYTYAKFKIHPGKTEEFKRLSRRCVEIVREREPGTLFYEWFMNADETECVAIDGYVDLDAVMDHVRNIGPTMRELIASCSKISRRISESPQKYPGLGLGRKTL